MHPSVSFQGQTRLQGQLSRFVTSRTLTPDLCSSISSTVFGCLVISSLSFYDFESARNMGYANIHFVEVDDCQRIEKFSMVTSVESVSVLQQYQGVPGQPGPRPGIGRGPSPLAQFLIDATLRHLVPRRVGLPSYS